MREGILIGRTGNKAKALTDVLPYSEARQRFNDARSDSKSFKDNEIIILQPVGVAGAKSAVKAVVAANEKRNSNLAEAEAVKPKGKCKAAALVALLFVFGLFTANAQQSIIGNLYSTTLNGTNANNGQSLQWSPNDVFTVEAVVTGSATNTNDITLTFDESLGGSYWTLATQTKTVDCANHTNATVTLFSLTNTLGTKYLRITQVERVVTNTATFNQLLWFKQ